MVGLSVFYTYQLLPNRPKVRSLITPAVQKVNEARVADLEVTGLVR